MQAVKIRGLGRLFVAFILSSAALSVHSAEYSYWASDGVYSARASSLSAACVNYASARNSDPSKPSTTTFSATAGGRDPSYPSSPNMYLCNVVQSYMNPSGPGSYEYRVSVVRSGDSCPNSDDIFDAENGKCDAPSKPCNQRSNLYSAQECTYIEALKVYNCPTSLSSDGCEYVSAGPKQCNKATNICTGLWAPSGDQASPNSEPCTEATCVAAPSPDLSPDPDEDDDNGSGSPSPSEQCVDGADGIRYCLDDPETGCGTFNGHKACPQPDQDCRSHNGEWICTDSQKDNRNCTYVKGEQVCVNPKNPTQLIPDTSPDHPKNGGNADGNPNNDPMDPSDTSGGTPTGSNPQGSDKPATNESIKGLGDTLGGKLDKGNSLLGELVGTAKAILGAMTGSSDGDGSGDGDGECDPATQNCDGAGDGEGNGETTDLASLISEKGDELLEERDTEAQSFLDALPDAVKSVFGEDGSEVGLSSDLLEDLFPAHTSCTDLTIPLNFMGKSFNIVIPVCELTRVKPLLEWLIWCITLIGLWNIFYTGLRQQDAKAVRGGF